MHDPIVVATELPTPDLVIVAPKDEGRVLVFADPRVSHLVVAETLARINRAIRRPGHLIDQLSAAAIGPAYGLG